MRYTNPRLLYFTLLKKMTTVVLTLYVNQRPRRCRTHAAWRCSKLQRSTKLKISDNGIPVSLADNMLVVPGCADCLVSVE